MLSKEFTTPLTGTPYYTNQGIIKVVDKFNRRFNVGEISLERFDEQNFQYVFKLYWDLIPYIPKGVFNGIPGINLDIKKEKYYRVNMTPTFISMRTPSESREDLIDLLSSVGLDYYDRFEWLLRSNSHCGDDNIIVVRKKPARVFDNNYLIEENIYVEDTVRIDNLGNICNTNGKLIEKTFILLQSGAKIFIKDDNRFLQNEERKSMMYLLMNMLSSQDRNTRTNRANGIINAKQNGRYTGRKPIAIDSNILNQVKYEFHKKTISEKEAMEKLGIFSRSTFYRKIKT